MMIIKLFRGNNLFDQLKRTNTTTTTTMMQFNWCRSQNQFCYSWKSLIVFPFIWDKSDIWILNIVLEKKKSMKIPIKPSENETEYEIQPQIDLFLFLFFYRSVVLINLYLMGCICLVWNITTQAYRLIHSYKQAVDTLIRQEPPLCSESMMHQPDRWDNECGDNIDVIIA